MRGYKRNKEKPNPVANKAYVNMQLIEKIEHIEENVNTLDNAVVGIQVEAFSTKYLLKNVPTKMKVGKKKEDIEDTKDTVEEILNIAEMNLKSIDQFYRMYSKENDKRGLFLLEAIIMI